MRRIGGGETDEGGLREVFRLRRTRAELRAHVTTQSLPMNPIEIGELLPALAVGRRCSFEQMDQALGERVGHDNPVWKIVT